MSLLRLANRWKDANDGEVGKLDHPIGNRTYGQATYLTGQERILAVEYDDKVVYDVSESITVSTTAVGLTEDFAVGHTHAFITVETAAIRYWPSGVTPTATAGHQLLIGDVLTLRNPHVLDQVLFIRRDGTDATIRVSYGRRR